MNTQQTQQKVVLSGPGVNRLNGVGVRCRVTMHSVSITGKTVI